MQPRGTKQWGWLGRLADLITIILVTPPPLSSLLAFIGSVLFGSILWFATRPLVGLPIALLVWVLVELGLYLRFTRNPDVRAARLYHSPIRELWEHGTTIRTSMTGTIRHQDSSGHVVARIAEMYFLRVDATVSTLRTATERKRGVLDALVSFLTEYQEFVMIMRDLGAKIQFDWEHSANFHAWKRLDTVLLEQA